MDTIIARPRRTKKVTGKILVLMAFIIAAAAALGGWAFMVALGIVGISVSFWEAVGLFTLVRLFILPGARSTTAAAN
jgi:hypothetical protein